MILEKKLKKNFIDILNDISIYIFISFPILITLRSFTLNLFLMIISIIVLLYLIKQKFFFLKEKVFIFIILFFILNLISNLSNSFIEIIKNFGYFRFLFLFFFIQFVNLKLNQRLFEKYKYIKLINFLFLIIICDLLIQVIFGRNILGFEGMRCDMINQNCSRYAGIFGDEFILGSFLAYIALPYFIYTYEDKMIYNFFPILLLIGVIFTGERASFLLIICFNLIFYYSLFFNKLGFVKTFFIILILIISLQISLPDNIKNRFSKDLIALNSASLELKESFKTLPWILHYRASLKIFEEKPLLGGGHDTFKKNCKKYEYLSTRDITDGKYDVCSEHPHQLHLEILNNQGLIGYTLILIFFILSLRNDLFNFKKLTLINKITLLYLIIIVLLPRPTGSIYSSTFGTFFWFSVSILLAKLNIFKFLK